MSERLAKHSLLRRLKESWGQSNPDGARCIAPVLVELFHPKTAVDFGCGSGTWTEALRSCGIKAVGLDQNPPDGDGYHKVDLETDSPAFTADLAICLEVAEHVSAESAEKLVDTLMSSAPVVVFAAGIPLQGGWHHVNEQWPSYWVRLFRKHGYACSDALRWRFWDNKAIPVWYRQDLLVFGTPETLRRFGLMALERSADVVHPENWEHIGIMAWAKRLAIPITALSIFCFYVMVFSLLFNTQ